MAISCFQWIDRRDAKDAWAAICRVANINGARVHDLRHTYASHYVMKGGTLHDLQALLGHASSEMTQKYSHLTPGHLESKSKVLSFSIDSDLSKWHQAI